MTRKILESERQAIQKAVLDFCNEQKASRSAYILRKGNNQPALEDSDRYTERKTDRLIKEYDNEFFESFGDSFKVDQDQQ